MDALAFDLALRRRWQGLLCVVFAVRVAPPDTMAKLIAALALLAPAYGLQAPMGRGPKVLLQCP